MIQMLIEVVPCFTNTTAAIRKGTLMIREKVASFHNVGPRKSCQSSPPILGIRTLPAGPITANLSLCVRPLNNLKQNFRQALLKS